MANARILGGSLIDDVTLTATSEALDADNLKDSDVRKVWRSTSTSDQEITADFGASVDINGIHLENLNLQDAGTIQLELSNDSGFSPNLLDTTFSPWADDLAHRAATKFFTSVSARYMRITFSDSSNPDGYIEAGRVMIGDFFGAPNSSNIAIGPSIWPEERGLLMDMRGGNQRAQQKTARRVIRCRWQWVHEDDAFTLGGNEFFELMRITGQRDDVVLSCYPEQGDDMERLHTIYGRIRTRSPIEGHFDRVSGSDVTLYSSLEIEVSESI